VVAVDHAGGVDPAVDQRPGRVPFAADVVAVLAHADVVMDHLHLAGALPGEVPQRDQRGLRRVDRTHTHPAPGQIGHRLDAGVGPHDDHGREVAVGVPHGQCGGGRCEPAGPHPGQRRVPRHVDLAGHQRLHLALVVGVQDVVEGQLAPREPLAEALPDGYDLGVVGHGPETDGVAADVAGGHQKRGSPHRSRPRKS
jgi:hypothetical protein